MIAFLVAVLASLRFVPLSPICFVLMGPAHWLFGTRMQKRNAGIIRQ